MADLLSCFYDFIVLSNLKFMVLRYVIYGTEVVISLMCSYEKVLNLKIYFSLRVLFLIFSQNSIKILSDALAF